MSETMNNIDVKALGKVAVLMGGSSAEREVSLMSGKGVLAALQSKGVDAHAFDPSQQDLGELRKQGFARCFIALHGRHGEDGTVQGALELLGIPYTGPGVMASSIAMDKIMTKRIWRFEGLSTPEWRMAASEQDTRDALAALGAPMIVKPAREGSTIGLSKISSPEECAQAYALASRYDPEVLCEQFIEGMETTCAVLGQGRSAQALPVIKIVAPEGNYTTQYFCPSELPDEMEAAIRDLAEKAFRTLGCRGWSRADVMVRASDQQLFLLEINTSPGMTSHSLVPMAARATGMSYEDLCLHLLANASSDAAQGAEL
jgi:D-alanine-D-alanine ligase